MRFTIKNVFSLVAGSVLLAPMTLNAGESVKIKAYGNSPDWQLVIPEKGNHISFTVDGQAGSYSYGKLGPSYYRSRKLHVYSIVDKKHSMHVFIKSNACTDSATGNSHEVSVSVTLDDKAYHGCGDVLTRLLVP